MATATYPGTAGITALAESDVFIPELWSDEVIAQYQKSLKMSPLVRKYSMVGKKGDLIHIPTPLRGDASIKAPKQEVTIQANVEDEMTIKVDRHFEYSRFIEDIVEVQAKNSQRQFYTEDAGYALARKVDTDLHSVGTAFRIDGTHAASGSTNVVFSDVVAASDYVHSSCFYNDITGNSGAGEATAYATGTVANADIFSDLFFRQMIQKLDENDVPMEGRRMIVPPSTRKDLTGIDRYTSSDFVNKRPVETGYVGELYGVEIYVSSNCPVIEDAASNAANSFNTRAGMLFHKDAIVHAEQMAVRSQTQYKQEFLSTLYTADTLYGVECYRPEAGFVMALSDG